MVYLQTRNEIMDAKKLGKKIKLARVENDMTQIELASAISSMQKSISKYETGMALPTLETLEKIAKVLKKPFAYFLDEITESGPHGYFIGSSSKKEMALACHENAN